MAESFQDTKSTNWFHSHILGRHNFAYPQRPLNDDEIRILEILPGGKSTRLHGRLEVVQRNKPGPYKALSYVWGTTEPNAYILIDGKAFWIRENLRLALYRIRRTDRVVRLWTDAICINQKSATEKNVQVQRMGETYAQADEVVIWLGTGSRNTTALSELCEFSRRIAEISRDELGSKTSPLIDFFRSPWFTRLWVLQEAVLARTATIILGSEECDLSLLYGISHGYAKVGNAIALQLEDLTLMDNVVLFSELVKLRLAIASNSAVGSDYNDYAGMVLRCSKRTCQDTRDHVFGLVGMAQHAGMRADIVNYALSVREVYQTFMQNALIEDLSRLVTFEELLGGSTVAPLPSWVPDLSRPVLASPYITEFYMAGGEVEKYGLPDSSLSNIDATLTLSGYLFDKIEAHRNCAINPHKLPTGANGDTAIPLVIHAKVAEELWFRDGVCSDSSGNHHAQMEACWRTLVGNVRRIANPDVNGIYAESIPAIDVKGRRQYDILMERADWPVDDEVESEEALNLIHSDITSNRSLLLTRGGYFGVGPQGTLSGDLIVIVPGLTMPLVLRESPNRNRYQLVGVAYVHGIMKGEFMEQVSGMSERFPETYVIE